MAKRGTTPRRARASTPPPEPGWVDAGHGYQLAIRDGKLVARRHGAALAAIPRSIRDGPIGAQLTAAIEYLDDHARTCADTVETWMLRSLAVPRAVIAAVFADDAWRRALFDAWLVPVAGDRGLDRAAGGFLRGVDPARGLGVVDRDGETVWLASELVGVPHPILLDELDDLRAMAVDIGASQGVTQLFRETFARPAAPPPPPDAVAVEDYAGGEFALLTTAIALAKQLGYRVIAGAAACRVLELGRAIEARYQLGAGDPAYPTVTGELIWVDEHQQPIALAEVPPIAWSEGVRMAAQLHARRRVDREGGDD